MSWQYWIISFRTFCSRQHGFLLTGSWLSLLVELFRYLSTCLHTIGILLIIPALSTALRRWLTSARLHNASRSIGACAFVRVSSHTLIKTQHYAQLVIILNINEGIIFKKTCRRRMREAARASLITFAILCSLLASLFMFCTLCIWEKDFC